MTPIPTDTMEVVRRGVARASLDFTENVRPLGFVRTRKSLWCRRLAHAVDTIHLHRSGSFYGKPINYSTAFRVEISVALLIPDAPQLIGPQSSGAGRRAGGESYHLRFNAQTNSTYERCISDLTLYVLEVAEPWFGRARDVDALLRREDSVLGPEQKERLRAALGGHYDREAVGKILRSLGLRVDGASVPH